MESIGGQAIVEGVLLRNRNTYATAVRNSKGKIVTKLTKIKDHRTGLLSVFKWPILRGMYSLYEMLTIGISALGYSSNVVADEKDEKISKGEFASIIFVSFLLTAIFFIGIPYALTGLIGVDESTRPVLFNVVDAIIKILFFLGYLLAISRLGEVQRFFQYHGAEHATVSCNEAGKELTVQNVKKFPTEHPRCGTSFIMLAIIVSIIVFSLLPLIVLKLFPALTVGSVWILKLTLGFLRLLILPIIIGLSYEVLKLAGKHSENWFFKIVSMPGIGFQKITTQRPDNKQIEVAIASMKTLLRKN